MNLFADLKLDGKRAQVESKLKSGPVWVYGATGSGRGELSTALSKVRDTVRVEPPNLDAIDAPLHALAQCALDAAGVELAFRDDRPLRVRAAELARALRSAGKTLVVRVPASWSFTSAGDTADEQRRKSDAFALVQGWREGTSELVLLTKTLEDTDSLARLFGSEQSVMLKRVEVRVDALTDTALWGPYIDAARSVQAELWSQPGLLTPLQVRLAIGVVALGADPLVTIRDVARQQSRSNLVPLIEHLKTLLLRSHRAVWAGLQAVAEARFPLPSAQALELSHLPPEHHTLLTQCVGYGTDHVRLPEPVRDALMAHRNQAAESVTHEQLALQYQTRDGALAPDQLVGPQLHCWLEKTHHLAHVETPTLHGLQRWEDLRCPSRFLVWDRARALSRDHHRYAEAATLYQTVLDRFGAEDDYSWHYFAFNLHRAGRAGVATEKAYRLAVQPQWPSGIENSGASNPWWNARLITFLISGGRETAAVEAWGAAIDAIDPDRARIAENGWLARQLHRWVVKAWLDVGDAQRARAVFGEIPAGIVATDKDLELLQWRLEDAEEAIALVESVYPASTPPQARWKKPQLQADELTGWAPGRVVRADRDAVVIVLADLHEGQPTRSVVRTTLTAKEWLGLGWCPPAEANGFIELHIWGDKQRILPVTAAQPPWEASGADVFLVPNERSP